MHTDKPELQNQDMDPVYFAGTRDAFSNFHPVPGGLLDPEFGARWPTSEHAFMARKARLFGDDAAIEALKKAASPQAAKAIGRRVRGFDAARWDAASQDAMRQALRLKFALPHFEAALLATGERELVEAAPWDRLWGIGMDAQKAAVTPRSQWGRNWLGLALMDVRAERRARQSAEGAR